MANKAVVPEQDTVVIEIEIAAPPERVFQALTDVKQLEQWWRSPICETTSWKMDPRPGGKWGFETTPGSQSVNGVNEYKCRGEILEYMPGAPARLHLDSELERPAGFGNGGGLGPEGDPGWNPRQSDA